MSYAFYKALHLLCLVLVTSCFGISFFSTPPKKWAKILGMSASVVLLVSGFGLIAKTSYTGGDTWPLWLKMKIVIWLLLAGSGPVLAKKLQTKRWIGFCILMALIGVAIILAVTKVA